MIECIQNMAGYAEVFDKLAENDFDMGVLRPWKGPDGKNYVTRKVFNQRTGKIEKRNLVTNAPATLSYDSWKAFDSTVQQTLTETLVAAADLRGRGLVWNLPNGIAHTFLQWQTQSDISRATVSMETSRRSEADRPTTNHSLLPLPIIHKDLDFGQRELASSRLGNMPLDTTGVQAATRKVAEELERMIAGVDVPFQDGGQTIYGLTNLPQRATKVNLTAPTGSNGETVITELLELRQLLIDDLHNGPYILYVNKQWAAFLDNEFKANSSLTLRQRILAIDDIVAVRTLAYLPTTKFHAVLVELKSDTIRLVVGTEVQVVQWESMGGAMRHYKVMMLQIPQIRADTSSNSGVAHARTA